MTRIIRSIAQNLLPRPFSGDVQLLDDASALALYASKGDPRAFEVLVHRYQSMVVYTCLRVMNSATDAEDAAQETFLKLARRAGEIRSNVAAWLHACALRTSIDLQRARATRRHAEMAIEPADASAMDDVERSWREIKPLLDEAIAALDERDRDLIVSRFLSGRSQVDMAREAGVHPGTMHRRINEALDKLRQELGKRGVTPAVALSAGTLAFAGAGKVSASLTSSFVSIGLAEMGASGSSALATSSGLSLATVVKASAGLVIGAVGVVGVVGVGMIGGWWPTAGLGPVVLGAAVASAQSAGGGFDRPVKETGRTELVAMVSEDKSGGTMTHTGDEIRLEFPSKKIEGKQESIVMRVKEAKAGSGLTEAKVLVESTTLPPTNPLHQIIGTPKDAKIRIDGDHVRFELTTDWTPTEEDKKADRSLPSVIVWTGGRAAPLSGADKSKATPSAIPAFAGNWNWVEEWQLRFDPDNIYLTWKNDEGKEFNVIRFRILDWENVGSHCRVQTIVSESSKDNAMIGKRVKLLVRRDLDGYTIVTNEPHAKSISEWPRGFDVKPGEGMTLVKFRGSER